MSETETETTTETTETNSLTTDEVRSILGEEIDARFTALGLQSKLEKVDKLDILDDLQGFFDRNKSNPPDQKGLLSEIDRLIDGKLAGLKGSGNESITTGRKPGPLSRWLGF